MKCMSDGQICGSCCYEMIIHYRLLNSSLVSLSFSKRDGKDISPCPQRLFGVVLIFNRKDAEYAEVLKGKKTAYSLPPSVFYVCQFFFACPVQCVCLFNSGCSSWFQGKTNMCTRCRTDYIFCDLNFSHLHLFRIQCLGFFKHTSCLFPSCSSWFNFRYLHFFSAFFACPRNQSVILVRASLRFIFQSTM